MINTPSFQYISPPKMNSIWPKVYQILKSLCETLWKGANLYVYQIFALSNIQIFTSASFMFLQEFALIDKKELAPLQELIESIVVPY